MLTANFRELPAVGRCRTGVKRHLGLLAQVAGLFATGWVVWSVAVLPRLGWLPLSSVLGEALTHALIACAASVFITAGLYLLIARSSRRDAFGAALRASSTAVWFAPAALLLSALSPVFLAAALALVIGATRLLYLEWRVIHPEHADAGASVERDWFEPTAAPLRFRDVAPSLIAAFGLQAGAVAVLMGGPLLAAILFSLATAMLTLAALAAGAYQPQTTRSLPRSILGLALTVILAVGFTVTGVANRMSHGSHLPWESGRRPGPFESVRALLERLLHGDEQTKPGGTVTRIYAPPRGGNVEIDDKSFPGVVIFSERRPEVQLEEPRPGWQRTMLARVQEEPSVIPFSGEYWMFRPPDRAPPRKSYARWGTPLSLSFVTTDHADMAMEAHQKLSHAIDLSCCAEIQIAIENGDRYPGTVEMELILSNEGVRQSLGRVAVSTDRDALLHFRIPANAGIHQFSEITVVFHRDRVRIDRSARISIERFVLAPRG